MRLAATTCALLLALAWGAPGLAQETPGAVAPPAASRPPDAAAQTLTLDTRDRVLLGGLGTFGAAYWAALYVGGTSDLTSDHLMLIPLVGPWISLAKRSPCGGPRAPSCGSNTTYRALIVADGIAQAAGAIVALAALFIPRSHLGAAAQQTPGSATPQLHLALSPAKTGDGWGLAAVAHF